MSYFQMHFIVFCILWLEPFQSFTGWMKITLHLSCIIYKCDLRDSGMGSLSVIKQSNHFKYYMVVIRDYHGNFVNIITLYKLKFIINIWKFHFSKVATFSSVHYYTYAFTIHVLVFSTAWIIELINLFWICKAMSWITIVHACVFVVFQLCWDLL